MKRFVVMSMSVILVHGAYAGPVEMAAAIRTAQDACAGISNDMDHLKKMAGINTAVTAVGTVAGGAGLAAGIEAEYSKKAGAQLQENLQQRQKEEKVAEENFKPAAEQLDEWNKLSDEDKKTFDGVLKVIMGKRELLSEEELAKLSPEAKKDYEKAVEIFEEMREDPEFKAEIEKMPEWKKDAAKKYFDGDLYGTMEDFEKRSKQIDDFKKENRNAEGVQKRLNTIVDRDEKIRTGTLAAGAATNIAGAVIGSQNQVKGNLKSRINACMAAVKQLENVRAQSRMDGAVAAEQMNHADAIISACGAWDTVDLSAINKRGKGAAITSGIGATMGIVGLITSMSAHNKDMGDDQGKNLGAASNVMAGGTAVAGGVATVFNATQIKAIKRAVEVADNCEAALQ